MAEQYTTSLSIKGAVSPELLASIKQLVGHAARVSKEVKHIGHESKEGFKLFEHGAELARDKVKELREVMSEALLPLLGITAAFKVFSGIGSTLENSIDKFKEARQQITSLRGVIEASDLVQKHGANPEAIMQQYLGISRELAEEQGKSFTESFYTGIQSTMSQVGLGPGLTKELTKNLVAFAALKKGSLAVTEDEMHGYVEMVDNALRSGKLGKSGRQFGLNDTQAKEFKKFAQEGNLAAEVNVILQGKMFKAARETIDVMRASPEGQLQVARVENAERMEELGKHWIVIQQQSETLALKLADAFMPFLADLGDAVSLLGPPMLKGMNGLVTGIQQAQIWMEATYRYVQQNWAHMFDGVGDSWNSMKSKMDFGWIAKGWQDLTSDPKGISLLFKSLQDIGHYIVDIASLMLPPLKQAWDAIAEAIQMNAFPQLKAFGEFIFGSVIKTGIEGLADAFRTLAGIISGMYYTFTHIQEIWGQIAGKPAAKARADIMADWQSKFSHGGHVGPDAPGTTPATLPHGAKGGFVSQPTLALIGEQGPELVSPASFFDKLTGLSSLQLDEQKKTTEANKAQLTQLTLVAQSLQAISAMSGGMGIGSSGFSMSSGGDTQLTHYGYPGDSTPDSNSMAGIGDHSNQLTALMSVALTKSERLARFGVSGRSTGQTFEYQGHMFRDDDTAPESNRRIDIFDPANVMRLAHGGIISSTTKALLGERGPEAVIPLNRSSLDKHGLLSGSQYSPTIHFNPTFNMSGSDEAFAERVADVVKDKFDSCLENSYFNFQRRRLA